MAKPPDLNGLAKQYLDLWQQQLGGIAEDEQAAEIMARTVELMNAGASTFAAMAATAQGYPTRGDDDANARQSKNKPPDGSVAPSPAAAPVASDHDLAEFARRLERLEERVAAMEAGAKKSRRKPAKKPRKG
jgi:hypothetical protein|tara:strand:- start:5005 stop:5400 length:396 start_codon:yes stop_codon:yes gene_type:complete